MIKMTQATILVGGMFGYRQTQVLDLEVTIVEHAQYRSAVRYTYVERGKRKRVGFVEGYRPTLVVLDGWQTIELADPMKATGPTSSITRHASCSDAWDVEFAEALTRSGVNVAHDFRKHDTDAPIACAS